MVEYKVSKTFGILRNEEYLQDVTLVTDDNNQVSAQTSSICLQWLFQEHF